jgi:hypothetical protein
VSLFDKSIKLESGLRRSNHIDHFISYKVEEYVNRIRKKTKIEKFNSCSPKDLGGRWNFEGNFNPKDV